jgi:hypothetical protein
MTRFKPQKKQEYNAQINLDVLDVNAQKMLRLILLIRNVTLVQTLNGGNSGQRKGTAVIQRPDYRMSSFSFEEDLIQAVTIIILPHIREEV